MVFDSKHSYHVCRDKSLFIRAITCEHDRVTMPSGETKVGFVSLKQEALFIKSQLKCKWRSSHLSFGGYIDMTQKLDLLALN